jgi:hypothetical protein
VRSDSDGTRSEAAEVIFYLGQEHFPYRCNTFYISCDFKNTQIYGNPDEYIFAELRGKSLDEYYRKVEKRNQDM